MQNTAGIPRHDPESPVHLHYTWHVAVEKPYTGRCIMHLDVRICPPDMDVKPYLKTLRHASVLATNNGSYHGSASVGEFQPLQKKVLILLVASC